MKIYPVHGYANIVPSKNDNQKKDTAFKAAPVENKKFELRSKFNDYMLSFGARVDKGLERFYDVNKDRMPYTVKTYVESLPDKKMLSPLEAQKKAFEKLESVQNIDEIKELFPQEPLFRYLMNPEDSHATRGILQIAREDAELLSLSDEDILKDKTNLTVYLVKKVFLEAKTIEEINKDLENDLNPDFKADFKFKNPGSSYILGSTLKALGIKVPTAEYQQSLRYTRAGYSDIVGGTISRAQIEFWSSLTPEQRIPRAKKSVENFENWWGSLTRNEKLELIAEKENILVMLKNYKKSERAAKKQQKLTETESAAQNIENAQQTEKTNSRIKVGSSVLGQDELFKIWATKNLEIFEETLSEADKDTLHLKRMRNLVQRWKEMSADEKTDYISRMKAGAEPARYAMIDAWNNSLNLVKALSAHLRENQIYKPADLLYSSQEFSKFQSKVMTEFWQMYPDYADMLGKKIREGSEKVETAIQRGTFEELKKQIMRDKKQRINELQRFKSERKAAETGSDDTKAVEQPSYKQEFKDAYNSHVYGKLKSIPKNFYNDMYEKVLDILPEAAVRAWTKNLKGLPVDEHERELIKSFVMNETPETARYNRALEAAMADTIYELTKNPDAFRLSNSDVKTVMYHLENGEDAVIYSHKTNETFKFRIINPNKKINTRRINDLYEIYKKDLTRDEINTIMHLYFYLNPDTVNSRKTDGLLDKARQVQQMLFDYISSYGKSAHILFSSKSAYPDSVKEKFNDKFLSNMPAELKEYVIPLLNSRQDIGEVQKYKNTAYSFMKRFDFIPAEYMDLYSGELGIQFKQRNLDDDELAAFLQRCCHKRKHYKETNGLIITPKSSFMFESKLKSLALEQAMADVLYEATGCEDVYGLEIENLLDNIELINLVKKFPSEERRYKPTGYDKEIIITANKKPSLYRIKQLYNEYLDEIEQWLSEPGVDRNNLNYEDLLYILNPEENNLTRDIDVAKRMAKYSFGLDKITINPNGLPIFDDEDDV